MKVFLIAGEASGDRLGAALIDGLQQLDSELALDGVGGAGMIAGGLTSRFEMSELSVMGIAEVLPKYRHLKRRIREMAEAVIETRPDVLVTIDSPDFCLRVARLVKEARPEQIIVHYVAPTVWAWRPERAVRMAGVVDHVLALFPFEPRYMEEAGVPCTFVGHPVATLRQPGPDDVAAFRAAHGVPDAPTLCALPGSRKGEVSRLAGPFGDAIARFASHVTGLQVILPVAPGLEELAARLTSHWAVKPHLLTGDLDKLSSFAAADIALAASGTVSLELAAAGTPMVIGYDMNWISRQIIQRKLLIDTVTLVNIVSETRVVPECIGAGCTPEAMAEGLLEVWKAPAGQEVAMALTMERLGRGAEAPGLRAARVVAELAR